MTRAALTGAALNSSRIVGRRANFNEFSIDEIRGRLRNWGTSKGSAELLGSCRRCFVIGVRLTQDQHRPDIRKA